MFLGQKKREYIIDNWRDILWENKVSELYKK